MFFCRHTRVRLEVLETVFCHVLDIADLIFKGGLIFSLSGRLWQDLAWALRGWADTEWVRPRHEESCWQPLDQKVWRRGPDWMVSQVWTPPKVFGHLLGFIEPGEIGLILACKMSFCKRSVLMPLPQRLSRVLFGWWSEKSVREGSEKCHACYGCGYSIYECPAVQHHPQVRWSKSVICHELTVYHKVYVQKTRKMNCYDLPSLYSNNNVQ